LDNKIKLSDERIYDINSVKDPIKHNCKGRPTIKRLKGYNEEKYKTSINKVQKENVQDKDGNLTNNTNGRKCSLCYKIRHYAPKYPNRNN